MATSASQSYVWFNSLINVDSIKVDMDITKTFEQAVAQKEEMVSTTILFNSFTRTIDASYLSPEDATAGAKFVIYRRTPHQRYYDFVCVLENGQYEFYDYNVANNEYYHYLASVEVETSSCEPEYMVYQSRDETGGLDYIKAFWNVWSICNIEEITEDNLYYKTGTTWHLGINMDGEELTQNTSVSTWDTLGVYPKISIGRKNYDSSTFSCLLGMLEEYTVFNGQEAVGTEYGYTEKNSNYWYSREVEKMQAWREFCSDGSIKLLKDLKGNKWMIQMLANPSRSVQLDSNLTHTIISFEWQEIEDITTKSIIAIGDGTGGILDSSSAYPIS